MEKKLKILGMGATQDACSLVARLNSFIYLAATPKGYIPLLKVLMTNMCCNDCAYCINRAENKVPRASFKPSELSRLFMDLYQGGWVKGLFLSSGNGVDPSLAMEDIIKTAEILRKKYHFNGYIHLKILPGSKPEYIRPACELASRASINFEAPSQRHLSRISSKKDFNEIMKSTIEIRKYREKGLILGGQTTQFVVGASGESDREIFELMKKLHRETRLTRIYFEALRPLKGTPLEEHPPTPIWRQNRLYQLDFLFRYGFFDEELGLAFDSKGCLSKDKDPKLIMTLKQPHLFPVDIKDADYRTLLHVPGIGPKTAKKIIQNRKNGIRLNDLKKMGVNLKRTLPFIKQGYQKSFF